MHFSIVYATELKGVKVVNVKKKVHLFFFYLQLIILYVVTFFVSIVK